MTEVKSNNAWWYKTVAYIREVPGTVYDDQVRDLIFNNSDIKDLPDDILIFLNEMAPDSFETSQKTFLIRNSITGGIYTIPSQRKFLDPILKKECGLKYNPYLYIDNYDDNDNKNIIDLSEESISNSFDSFFGGVFSVNDDVLNIKLDEGLVVRNFDINSIINEIKKRGKKVNSIGYIIGQGTIFEGKANFVFEGDYRDFPPLIGGMFFDRAVFTEDFEMQNFTFDFNNSNCFIPFGKINKVDFRNARFFKKASFRDIRFGGDTIDSEITFEDARIQDKIEFINVSFEHTRLNFFQTIFGNYINFIDNNSESKTSNEIVIINSSFSEDSLIDFSDSEIINGKILLHNISTLPITKLCFSPITDDNGLNETPRNILMIKNCEVKQTLYIGNVSQLSFKNSRNYGRIISADNWGSFPTEYKKKTIGLFGTQLGGTRISNNLLLAVYNFGRSKDSCFSNDVNRNKAKDFMVLKENFAAEGAYDDEDDAFILYMEFKPYSIWYLNNKHRIAKQVKNKTKKKKEKKSFCHSLLYKALYDTGKYGISPGRVIVALLFLVVSFAVLYLFFAVRYGTGAFSIGSTNNNQFNYANEIFANMNQGFTSSKLLASFLYSLEGVIPFVSQFEPINVGVCILTAMENAIGSFLVGYFSVAVVRKTLR